jgi:hypothetical protein
MAELSLADQDLRGLLARMIAKRGHAPAMAELAEAAGLSEAQTEAALRRLHEAHALLLHPHRCAPWVVHPFALSAGSCWVDTAERGYWANCLYCGLGIAAATRSDTRITTRLGGEGETHIFRLRAARSSIRVNCSTCRRRSRAGGTMSSSPAPRSSLSPRRLIWTAGARATRFRAAPS